MFKKIFDFFFDDKDQNLWESLYADEYTDPKKREYILEKYNERFPEPKETPWTHPWKFNPLLPPVGWRYDPYYELWLKENKK